MNAETNADLSAMRSLIDGMQDAVAIITQDGEIVAVNETWRTFSGNNDGDTAKSYLGQNYIGVCQTSADYGDPLATPIMRGIATVLAGGDEFVAEYPCHGPTEKRWFEVVARPFDLNDKRFTLIAHRNITSKVTARHDADYARRNAQNLAAIVTTMADPVIAFDLDGIITSWNAAATRLYGYDRDEAIGQTMEMLYPPDWPKRIHDYISEIIVSELKHFDALRKTKSGELRTIEITAAPIRSANGEIVGISNVHRDVTHKRAAEHRVRSILDNLFSFVGILELDGTLVEANKAPLAAAGLEPEDVIGKKFWDCFWWTHSAEVAEKLRDDCARAKAGEVIRYDAQIQVQGGQFVWIDFQLAPLRNEDGEIVNLVPSGIDISERLAMVEALEQSHNTFQNLVARSPFGIYTVDADFRIAHVSIGTQKAFASVKPLIGRRFDEAFKILWPEEFAQKVIDQFKHTLATGEPYNGPTIIETRHDINEVESYDWMIERIVMPDGRYGVMCNFYDLSEREKYEQHIRLLMSEVNHRSKNLLAVVLSMARQTARASSPDQFVEHFSQRLLGLSASQNLIVEGSWGGVDLQNLVLSQLRHLGDEVRTNRIELDGPQIIVSPPAAEGIGMAIHELSTNALKYGSLSGSTGGINISWSVDDTLDGFQMRWEEHGGPAVSPPERTGFGRTVIERMAANSVGGSVEINYAKNGLVWTVSASIKNVRMYDQS